MADQKDEAVDSPRRARAPTITIDTTAVNQPNGTQTQRPDTYQPILADSDPYAAEPEASSPATTVGARRSTSLRAPGRGPSMDGRDRLTAQPSFESKESRPTSPHNVSSPVTARGHERHHSSFLAVPDTRQRQNSLDSTEGSRSIASSMGDAGTGTTLFASEHGAGGQYEESEKIMHDANALKPDHGTEEEFEVKDNPFAFSPGELGKMFNPKSLAAFYKLGGLAGIEKGLRTDRKAGLGVDEGRLDGRVTLEEAASRGKESTAVTPMSTTAKTLSHGANQGNESFCDRKRVFGDNRLPEKKGKTLLQLMWITYNDKVLILLTVAALVSLAVGLYQTFGTPHDAAHPAVEWVEGVAIVVAIAIVVIVGSVNDYSKERQFAKLNRKKTDREVRVIRSGKTGEISVHDILAGDVLHLEPGDMVPVDGILIEGFNVKCDESQATGESDIIKKTAADQVYAAIENHEDLAKADPFIQSGARVMEGIGTFLVTSTGIHSSYGKTMMRLNDDPEITPLQSKLNVIAEYIAKGGIAAAVLLFVAMLIRFGVRVARDKQLPVAQQQSGTAWGQSFLNILIVVVTIIVVAVPEGLPLAVTLALAFATTRMLKDNNLVRHLKACEVMGNASTICSDKTGTLTQNKMQVVAGTLGTSNRFGGAEVNDDKALESPDTPASPENVSDLTPANFTESLGSDVRTLLKNSITLNSTAFEGEMDGQMTFIGSKTETALLIFARDFLAMGSVSEERANAKILQLFPFDSGRKCMGVVIELPNGKARLFVKGASEIVLEQCTRLLQDPTKDLTSTALSSEAKETISDLIETYAKQSLRTIVLAYRDFDRWPPARARRADDNNEISFSSIGREMTFVGMVGIKDPLRPGVLEAVRECQRAGVVVRMVTGDNKTTAKAIAGDCGILQPDSVVLEGPVFRNMPLSEQKAILPHLHIVARSSPEDKRILVGLLKDRGDIVAVTGDGTNDAPALKLADVGFSMGITGTEVAKEASAIILMDDNFKSIVKALKWGRAVNDAVKKFLQFQLTVNITAVILTFVSALYDDSETSVLTAVQLLWVNLIMDTLAALALATDPPQDSVLDRKPERRGASIITTTMWKMIIGQAIYQLAITFLLYFGSPMVLPSKEPITNDQIQTLVFNTFVWMQIFNQWNNRRLDNRLNIFEGLTKNIFFIAISLIMVGGQTLIVFKGGVAFNIASEGQSGAMWGYALVLGFISIPVGVLIRLIPDSFVAKLVPAWFKKLVTRSKNKKKGSPDVTVSGSGDEEASFTYYPEPLADVRDELTFLKHFKGGRLNNLRFAMKHPAEIFTIPTRAKSSPSTSVAHSRSNSINTQTEHPRPSTPTRENSFGSVKTGNPPPSPSNSAAARHARDRSKSGRSRSNSALGAVAVMSGIVAGSIGAGWSPIDRSSSAEGRDFGQFPPPQSAPATFVGDRGGANESAVVEEPEEAPAAGPSEATNVPRLSVPKPPAPGRKSLS